MSGEIVFLASLMYNNGQERDTEGQNTYDLFALADAKPEEIETPKQNTIIDNR